MCVRCTIEGGRVKSFRRLIFCAGVRAKLFWIALYCTKPRPDPGSQSSSRSRRGLGRRAPRIMWEYDLTTVIAIRPLTQPHTCEMGSSGFAAMSRLKFVRTTRASFRSMPSTERTNREKCLCCSWQCLLCSYLFSFSHRFRRFSIGSFL